MSSPRARSLGRQFKWHQRTTLSRSTSNYCRLSRTGPRLFPPMRLQNICRSPNPACFSRTLQSSRHCHQLTFPKLQRKLQRAKDAQLMPQNLPTGNTARLWQTRPGRIHQNLLPNARQRLRILEWDFRYWMICMFCFPPAVSDIVDVLVWRCLNLIRHISPPILKLSKKEHILLEALPAVREPQALSSLASRHPQHLSLIEVLTVLLLQRRLRSSGSITEASL